jgi:hypothetical protein
VTEDQADRLAAIAVELVQRVRDDDPVANGRWLSGELPDPADWWALCFILAAAVPDDRSWNVSTAWTRSPAQRRFEAELALERFGPVMPPDLRRAR